MNGKWHLKMNKWQWMKYMTMTKSFNENEWHYNAKIINWQKKNINENETLKWNMTWNDMKNSIIEKWQWHGINDDNKTEIFLKKRYMKKWIEGHFHENKNLKNKRT